MRYFQKSFNIKDKQPIHIAAKVRLSLPVLSRTVEKLDYAANI